MSLLKMRRECIMRGLDRVLPVKDLAMIVWTYARPRCVHCKTMVRERRCVIRQSKKFGDKWYCGMGCICEAHRPATPKCSGCDEPLHCGMCDEGLCRDYAEEGDD